MEILKNGYLLSDDRSKIQIEIVHQYLSNKSYWAKNIPFEIVEKSIQNSLCFGIYDQNQQVAFARIISDFAAIAYLGDVFVLETHRKKGLSKWLLESIRNHPDLQGLRRWILLTGDAHELYKKYGWHELKKVENWMEINEIQEYPKL